MSVFGIEHADALLAYIRSVDPRWAAVAQDQAETRSRAWATILADVDPAWALAYARRFYSRDQSERIAPGMIRQAWRTEARVQEARDRPAPTPSMPVPPNLAAYMRECLKASAEGRDPAQVPKPATAKHMTKADDIRSRLCRYWKGCACDHTKCRDGWLDEEQGFIGQNGLPYSGVQPCPHCHDAAIMAAEPVMKGKRR